VKSGTTPTKPHADWGPTKTSDRSPIPKMTRIMRSALPSLICIKTSFYLPNKGNFNAKLYSNLEQSKEGPETNCHGDGHVVSRIRFNGGLFIWMLTGPYQGIAIGDRVKNFFRVLNQFWQKVPYRNYIIIFIGVTALLIIGITQVSDDDTGPCAPTQYFGECYDIPRTLCETTLAVIKTSCSGLIKSITKPGQLVGPIERNCQQLKFDRILKYTRKSNPICIERINRLDEWQKTNPDF